MRCLTCEDRTSREEVQRRLAEANPDFQVHSDEVRPDGDIALPDDVVQRFHLAHCVVCGSDALKPDVVFFGESVPRERVDEAYRRVEAASALLVVLGFAAAGFAWWEAYPVLTQRYWEGIASERPASYWMWGNLAALMVSAGPLLGAGLAQSVGDRETRRDPDLRPLLVLAGGAALAVVVADVSRMSKGEVERIWLPFVPWLTLTMAALPGAWRRWGLAIQVASALLVQHLLYTTW